MFAIVALVLLFLLPSPWNLVGFACSLGLFLCELTFWHRRVRGQPKKVGAQTLVGQTATVISTCRPEGQVRLSGRSGRRGAPAGQTRTTSSRSSAGMGSHSSSSVRPPSPARVR